MEPVLVAGGPVAAHIMEPLHVLGPALHCRLVQQVRQCRDFTDIVGGHLRRGDFMRIGVDREMQLAPVPTRPDPTLLIEPLSLDQKM